MGNVYAYVRVSSKDQNEDRQVLCMKELQVPEPNIFIDKQSGNPSSMSCRRKSDLFCLPDIE